MVHQAYESKQEVPSGWEIPSTTDLAAGWTIASDPDRLDRYLRAKLVLIAMTGNDAVSVRAIEALINLGNVPNQVSELGDLSVEELLDIERRADGWLKQVEKGDAGE